MARDGWMDSEEFMAADFPPAVPQTCNDCPWRRIAVEGWLGPHSAEEWIEIAHSESPIACHQTILETDEEGIADWKHPAMRQCRGAAIFRANVAKKPKNHTVADGPTDHDNVFSTNDEFIEYHKGNKDFVDPLGAGRRMAEAKRKEAAAHVEADEAG